MGDSMASLSRKISSAGELQSVVRTMKALAAANISQYEQSVRALADYKQAVALSLSVCLRAIGPPSLPLGKHSARPPVVRAVVFGSDQGLVGQFNESITDFAITRLATLPSNAQLWAVGECAHASLADAGLTLLGLFAVPQSVQAIAPLIGQILLANQTIAEDNNELYLFYNHPTADGLYTPTQQRLLPLDDRWLQQLAAQPWSTRCLPDVLGDSAATLSALTGEYLFVSLFRACAESLASENASRLAAMERADQNIDGLLESLYSSYHQLRQSGIDEELFDVIAGYEALAKEQCKGGRM